MSFGGVMVDLHGPTDRFPGLSLLAGLLGNALGLRHGDAAALETLPGRIEYAAPWDLAPSPCWTFGDLVQKPFRFHLDPNNRKPPELLAHTPHTRETLLDWALTFAEPAYMAGRHRQAMEQIDRAPFAQYLAVRDSRTRPAHAALHGKVFRIDSPQWAIIAPPNGYNCRCRARYMSQRELDRRGLKVEEDARLVEREPPGRRPLDTMTGQTPGRWVQRGVSVPSRTAHGRDTLWADVGWDHLPGSDGAERVLVDRLMGGARDLGGGMREAAVADIWRAPREPLDHGAMLPECDGGAASFAEGKICLSPRPGQPTYRDLGRPDLRDPAIRRQVAPPLLPRAATRVEALATLESVLGVDAANPSRIVRTPLEPVVIARGWLPHVVEKEADGRERFAHFIVPTLEDPFEVWNVLYTDGGVRRRYIGLFAGAPDLMVVVRENLDGSLFWNVMHAKSKQMNGHRLGDLAYGK